MYCIIRIRGFRFSERAPRLAAAAVAPNTILCRQRTVEGVYMYICILYILINHVFTLQVMRPGSYPTSHNRKSTVGSLSVPRHEFFFKYLYFVHFFISFINEHMLGTYYK